MLTSRHLIISQALLSVYLLFHATLVIYVPGRRLPVLIYLLIVYYVTCLYCLPKAICPLGALADAESKIGLIDMLGNLISASESTVQQSEQCSG